MSLTAKEPENTKDYDPIEEGMHHAICYALYDIGSQTTPFSDKPVEQVVLIFELPDERIQLEKDGEEVDLPRAISSIFRNSLHKKANLRKFLESWRSKKFTKEELTGFDLRNILGVNCMLQVLHKEKENGNKFAYIQNIVPLMKGMEKRKTENQLVDFDINLDKEIPINTPEWVKDKIKASVEWDSSTDGKNLNYDELNPPPEDDIPF